MAAKRIACVKRDIPVHWVGDGFPVRSLFSYQEGSEFDPFLLLDYAGPHKFTPSEVTRGVGEHPHRGFETVTIVYQGELEHRDSSGSHGTIGPGDVQWMTAASGVVHEEFHSERFSREGGTLEMVQLWVNLPAKEKLSTPRYQGILSRTIPNVSLPNNAGAVRVIAGELMGIRGPAMTVIPINVWDIELKTGGAVNLDVPRDHTLLLLVQSGAVEIEGAVLQGVELVRFERDGTGVALHAASNARILVLTGQPLDEPVYGQGPFVMTSREEIHAAIRDYQAGKMGHVTARP